MACKHAKGLEGTHSRVNSFLPGELLTISPSPTQVKCGEAGGTKGEITGVKGPLKHHSHERPESVAAFPQSTDIRDPVKLRIPF